MIEFLYKRPVTIAMITLTILIFGIISLLNLPVSLMPDTKQPVISVITRYHGVASEQIEKIITIPIENAVSTVSGIKEMRSTSEEGKSTVMITFEEGVKMKHAVLNVIEATDGVSYKFPQAAHKPYIIRNKPDDKPIFIISLRSDVMSLNDLRFHAERVLKKDILRLEGVSEVDFSGGSIREIHFNMDKDALLSYQIPITDIPKLIQENYFVHSGGDIYEQNRERNLFTDARFKNFAQMNSIPIHFDKKTNKYIYIQDVATITESPREKDSISRVDGNDCVNVYIKKSGDANTIDVCEKVNAFVTSGFDSRIKPTVVYNQADYIKKSVNNLIFTALLGGIIAVLVLFVFIRDYKAVILIAFSIPFSLFFTFFCMYLARIEFNIMTISGLALGIGMLLDNGVVMIRALHDDLSAGSWRKTNGIIIPILSSTITTVGVFAPFMFLSEEYRRLYGGLALTVTFSLLSSVLCALVVIPGGYAFLTGMGFKERAYNTPLSDRIEQVTMKIVTLLWKKTKISLIVIALVVITAVLSVIFMKKEYLDPLATSEVTASVELDSGTSLEETARIVGNVEDFYNSQEGIVQVSSRIQKWHADIDIRYNSASYPGKDSFINTMKVTTDTYQDCFVHYQEKSENTGKILNIDIIGDDDVKLRNIAGEAAGAIMLMQGVRNVVLRFKEGRPSITWKIDRTKAFHSGVNIAQAGEQLRWGIYGPVALKYIKDNKEMDLRVQFSEADTKTVAAVKEFHIFNEKGQKIKLKEIGAFIEGAEPGRIYRKNKRKSVSIGVYLAGLSLDRAVTGIDKQLNTLEIPKGYYFDYGNSVEKMKESQQGGAMALVLAVFMIFSILAFQFNSMVTPLKIIPVIPVCTSISIIVLATFNMTLNLSVFIGFVVLSGVAVNNAILIADGISARNDCSLRTIYEVTRSRIKPILITSLTTILALIPLIIGRGEGSALWQPLAITLASGLIAGIIINLGIFPLLFLPSFRINLKKSESSEPEQ